MAACNVREKTAYASSSSWDIVAVFPFIVGAHSMPAAGLHSAVKAADQVIQARDGCGPHRWRGPHGRCHWDSGWRR